jgi:G3E family GTPase
MTSAANGGELDISSHSKNSRVPVTIISGFLGAGKTTLLRHVLTSMHGKRVAVIENEFADEMGIESLILKNGLEGPAADGFYELQNGCLCCTMKDDLVLVLEKLMIRSKEKRFDAVLIETSGMANPGPVASTFWSDTGDLDAQLELDGIVTVVDSSNVLKQLGTSSAASRGGKYEAEKQIGCADVILLNKIDLVGNVELQALKVQLGQMNSAAQIIESHNSSVNLDLIMGLRAYDVTKWSDKIDIDEKSTSMKGKDVAAPPSADVCNSSSHHLHTESCLHDTEIHTIVIQRKNPVDLKKITHWIGSLIWPENVHQGFHQDTQMANDVPIIFRGKGVLCIQDVTSTATLSYLPSRYILQSVHEQFDIQPAEGVGSYWKSEQDSTTTLSPFPVSKIILIGKNLNKDKLQEDFLKL